MFITDGIFAHHWFFSREAEYSPALCKGVIKFLCDVLEADCNTKIRSESMCDLCPALKYFEGQEVTCWSWEQVMRLSVLFTTTKWEELLRCSECLQQDVIEKILEMFQSCSMEETPDEDALAIVERMLLPRLKERSTEVI
ncbi:hypothetical protein OSTOST_14130, partial [Ostertagia ostertagi]